MSNEPAVGEFELFDLNPSAPDIQAEVLAGMRQSTKQLSPKFFYDENGSELFDRISRLPEYYLTRVEIGILRAHAAEIAKAIGPDSSLIEYGSGSGEKSRLIIEACRPWCYIPVDISREMLVRAARQIHREYPSMSVYPVCADYTEPFTLPHRDDIERPVAFFPGSSIGNFDPDQAVTFLHTVGSMMGSGGMFLIGVDTEKPSSVLNRAYNDKQGLTREFNLNVLTHLNQRIESNFVREGFEHFAEYVEEKSRIEMHLVSRRRQSVHIDGHVFELQEHERIHTENSYKYTPDSFTKLADLAGFDCVELWLDEMSYFMIGLLSFR